MFFPKKSKKLWTTIDLHSHLLPGIDDGCSTIEESISLIKNMKRLGYTKLCITPHIMKKKYPNTTKIITDKYHEVVSMLKVLNIDIEISVAAEYYCDQHFLDLMSKKELLTFGKQYILFELPYTTRPDELETCIDMLHALKLKPVLAHPERYRFLQRVHDFKVLKNLGVCFQVNINSLGGYYGVEVQKKALMLSQKGMIDFIGSDLHHETHLRHLKNNLKSNIVETVFRNNKILNDVI